MGTDMIYWYSKKLYDEWYASLTEGQREKLRKAEELERKRERDRAVQAAESLIRIFGHMIDLSLRGF